MGEARFNKTGVTMTIPVAWHTISLLTAYICELFVSRSTTVVRLSVPPSTFRHQ